MARRRLDLKSVAGGMSNGLLGLSSKQDSLMRQENRSMDNGRLMDNRLMENRLMDSRREETSLEQNDELRMY